MANFTSVHTGATIDASVTIISGSGVTQSDLTKLNAVTSSAVELNILDGVTASTAEINILDGLTASTTELNYLDGADSSITTLSLPDNTTITTFGASLVDDADAATARTTLGVDPAGTDNSTDVTLVTTSYDYLSLSGQAITLGQIDISDDTNLVGGDGLALTGDTLSVNVDDSSLEINSDTLRVKASGVTNAMLANSSLSYGGVSVALGASDATPAFDLSDATSLPIVAGTTGTLSVARGGTGATTASGARTNLNVDVAGTDNSTDVTLVTTSHDYLSLSGQAVTLGQIDISDDTNLVGGTGITLTGDTLSTTDSEIVHDNLSGFVSNEHIDHSSVSITAGTGLSGGGDITTSRTLTTDDSAIVHDNLSGFVANEHIDHSGVSITAGAGLTGGGDITATRDIAVGAGTGVTVNADDIAIGQDVATSADVTFNSVTSDDFIGSLDGAVQFEAKATVALNKGDAVYVVGISGNTPTIALADANDAAKMPSFGLAASSASIDDVIEVVTFGTLTNINTSAFSQGDVLFISSNGTSGNTLTATKEAGESILCQNIGKVIRSHATVGSIKVGGAGRANATPNLNDGNIFIGNGSNQAVTAALNTKIQDYLNTGVNLPSPTFSGDIAFNDASTPVFTIKDTTNNVQADWRATDTLSAIGTTTDSPFYLKQNGAFQVAINSSQIILNSSGEDRNTIIKDSSGTAVFKVDAGTSTTEIGTLSVTGNSVLAGDLQVNGTTTTVNQTNLDVSDNIIGLNRGAASNANDSGLIIERGSTGDNVFIGWDESLDRIRFATTAADASSTGDLSLTNANIHAGRLYADVTGNVTGNADTATTLATARNFSLTGDVTAGAVSFDGSGNVTLATTIAADSVALGTDTTGNYMSDLTEGTGVDITHTPAEGSNATITLDLTEVGFGGGANRLITDDGDGTVSTEANLTFDGTNLDLPDSKKIRLGTSQDLEIYHDGTNSVINNTQTGNLQIYNNVDNGMIELLTDNGSGGTQVFLRADGANNMVRMPVDGVKFTLGDASDLQLYHDGSNNYLRNNTTDQDFNILVNDGGSTITALQIDASNVGRVVLPNDGQKLAIGASEDLTLHHTSDNSIIANTTTGDLYIQNSVDDKDIIFRTDDGSGGVTPYLTLDGGLGFTTVQKLMRFNDDVDARFGTSSDLRIRHDGTDSKIDNYTGTLKIRNTLDDANITLETDDGSGGVTPYITLDGSDARIYADKDIRIRQDNTYLTLGASGSDMYMYHDGTNSWIRNNTGHLYIRNDSDGSDIYFGTNDDVGTLNYTMAIDGTNNRVGIGTNSPESKLHIEGLAPTIILHDTDTTISNGQSYGAIQWHTADGSMPGTDDIGAEIKAIDTAGYGDRAAILFSTAENTTALTERMRIASGGNVGMGTTSPAQPLDVNGRIRATSLEISDGNAIMYRNSGDFELITYGGYDINLMPSGNVGIGTTSPQQKLHIFQTEGGVGAKHATIRLGGYSTVGAEIAAYRHTGNSNDQGLIFSTYHNTNGTTDTMTLDSLGNVGIGTGSPEGKVHIYQSDAGVAPDSDGDDLVIESSGDTGISILSGEADGNTGALIFGSQNDAVGALIQYNYYENRLKVGTANSGHSLQFATDNNTLAMTIDSSQNVGIGTVSPGAKFTVLKDGTQASSVSTTYQIQTVSASNGGIAIQAGASSHAYLVFGDNGDYDAGRIGYENANHNLKFFTNNAQKLLLNTAGDLLPEGDGTQDLGASSKRWGVIYSADLDLSNEGSENDVDGTWGSYVIQEGEDDLFLINRRSGKKYKFMLQEVQD